MKICWDNLEGLFLTKMGYFRNTKKKKSYVYVESCINCGEPFLKEHGSKGTLCSKKCSLNGKNNPFYGKCHSAESRKKISERLTTVKNYYWLNNLPFFDTYAHQIEKYEDVQRNVTDMNILEIKCVYCGKWYIPTLKKIIARIQFLKGNIKNKNKNTFYCKDCNINEIKNYYWTRNIPYFDTYAHQINYCEDV